MLVNRAGTMVVPFMTLYLTQRMGFSMQQAGWVMAVFGAGAVCGGFLGGRLVDKFGFYYVQITTLIGGGIMFLILGQMKSYPLICVCSFLLSLINDSFRPANAAAIAHYSKPENRTRSFSLNRLSINLGWSFGGVLGGFIAAHNYELLFIIDGLTNISGAFLLWFLLAPSKNKDTPTRKTTGEQGVTVRSAYKDRAFLMFTLFTVMYAFCFFQLFTTMPVFYREDMKLTEQVIGIIMALNGLIIAVVEMALIHKLEGRGVITDYIFWGTLMLAFSFIMFNIFPLAVWVAMLSAVVMSFGEMLSMPFMNTYWISRTEEANRGQYAGLYTVSWSTAQILGPVTGAQIAGLFGFSTLWWTIGGLCVVVAFGFRYLKGK